MQPTRQNLEIAVNSLIAYGETLQLTPLSFFELVQNASSGSVDVSQVLFKRATQKAKKQTPLNIFELCLPVLHQNILIFESDDTEVRIFKHVISLS